MRLVTIAVGLYPPYPGMPHMLPPDLSPGANPLMPPHGFAAGLAAAAAAAGGIPYGRGPSALVSGYCYCLLVSALLYF